MRAVVPRAWASSATVSSSCSDSTLKQRMSSSSAAAISRRILPTPENVMLLARHADSASAAQFALRDDVHPGAELRQRSEHGLLEFALIE